MTESIKIPMHNCPICYRTKGKDQTSFLPCGCSSCSECLEYFLISQIEESHCQIKEKFQCMAIHCKTSFILQDITYQLTKESVNAINQALFTNYINNTKDIACCPSEKCKYARVIDISPPCRDYLRCEVCKTQWREKVHYTKSERVKDIWIQIMSWANEPLSYLWIEYYTKPCPNCGVLIEKGNGCDHVTCARCKHDFCWICKEKHPSHNKAVHTYENETKPLFKFLFTLSVFALTILALYQIPFVQTSADLIVTPAVNLAHLFRWPWRVVIATVSLFAITELSILAVPWNQKKKYIFILAGCCLIFYRFSSFLVMAVLLVAVCIAFWCLAKITKNMRDDPYDDD